MLLASVGLGKRIAALRPVNRVAPRLGVGRVNVPLLLFRHLRVSQRICRGRFYDGSYRLEPVVRAYDTIARRFTRGTEG